MLALVGVGAIAAIVIVSAGGTAPSNGEQVFDAPGCLPYAYDGPGHGLPAPYRPNCPLPRPLVALRLRPARGALVLEADGSRSVSPDGSRIVRYQWNAGAGFRDGGPKLDLTITHAGIYRVLLVVTDGNGLRGIGGSALRVG